MGGGGGRSASRGDEVERRMGDVDGKVLVIFQAKFSLFLFM